MNREELELIKERIREAVPLDEFARSEGIDLPKGENKKAKCPFHDDSTPSCSFHREWFYCFGCGEKGDLFSFYTKRHNVTFMEAMEKLADHAGIKFERDNDEYRAEIAKMQERAEMEMLLTKAAAYYHHGLPDKIREKFYHQQYGFTDETVDKLQLGWADGNLFEYFMSIGVTREQALKTGLFIAFQGGDGAVKDFFEYRLVFPYWKNGHVVYFIARKAEPYTNETEYELAKYKKLLTNSENHPYVSPSIRNDYFWGEDNIKGNVEELLVTEGVTDAISAYQADIKVISPVTVRFRKEDAPKLVRLTKNVERVIICNDNEENDSGTTGGIETGQVLHEAGRDVRMAVLPRPAGIKKIDVNEYLKANTREDFKKVLDQGRRYIDFLMDLIPEETKRDDLGPKLENVFKAIAVLPTLARDVNIDSLCKKFKLRRKPVRSEVEKFIITKKRDGGGAFGGGGEGGSGAGAGGGGHGANGVPQEKIRGEILSDLNFYYVLDDDGNTEIISSFSLTPKQRVAIDGKQMFICDVNTDRGKTIEGVRLPQSSWHSKRDFIKSVQAVLPDLQWTGTDDNVAGLSRLLTRVDVPVKTGTHVMGYNETSEGLRWVLPDRTLTEFGNTDDTVYISEGGVLDKLISMPDIPSEDVRKLAAEVLPLIRQTNLEEVITPILGWFFATPFRPRLIKLIGHFPILLVWGSAGSGKTSIVQQVFWRMLGMAGQNGKPAIPFSVTETRFSLLKILSSTSSIPIFMDEYKPRDMDRESIRLLHRQIRRLYGGETEHRGRADQSVASYDLSAPICIAGEAKPEESAILERLIAVSPNKNTLDNEFYRDNFKKVRQMPLEALAAPFVRWSLSRDTKTDLMRSMAVSERLLENYPNLTERPRDNVRVMVFGLTMFEEWANSLGVEIGEFKIGQVIESCIQQVVQPAGQIRNNLDHFIESLFTFAIQGSLQDGIHYAMVNKSLCIHVQSCHHVYMIERRRAGLEDATDGVSALRRSAQENIERKGYVISVDKRVKLGEHFVRCLEIDPEELKKDLGIETFPAMTRTWGGKYGQRGQNRYEDEQDKEN